MTKVPDHLDDVGPGWRKILEDLHEDLMKCCPDYEVAQVKEKFGGLRVYLDASHELTREAVSKAEDRAWRTCEHCGKPGTMDHAFRWVLTLCDECKAARKAARDRGERWPQAVQADIAAVVIEQPPLSQSRAADADDGMPDEDDVMEYYEHVGQRNSCDGCCRGERKESS